MEAQRDDRREAGDTRETIKLTEIYSMGCSRLARLLRSQVPHKNRLSAYVDGMVDQTITGLNREWGWIE
jgi:hypothetical protein